MRVQTSGSVKAPAEVAGGGGVGNALGAQGVEEGFVLAEGSRSSRQVAAGQDVVGEGQHVVGLVVGQMDLEQVESAVDGARCRPQLPGQQVDGPDAAAGDAAVAGGEFIVDVGGGQDGRPRRAGGHGGCGRRYGACGKPEVWYTRVFTRNASLRSRYIDVNNHILPHKPGRFGLFFKQKRLKPRNTSLG